MKKKYIVIAVKRTTILITILFIIMGAGLLYSDEIVQAKNSALPSVTLVEELIPGTDYTYAHYLQGKDSKGKVVWKYYCGTYEDLQNPSVSFEPYKEKVYAIFGGRLTILNRKTGKVIKRSKPFYSGDLMELIVDNNGNIYTQEWMSGGIIYKLSGKGKLLWKTNIKDTGNSILCEMKIKKDKLKSTYYYSTGDSKPSGYVILNKNTGKIFCFQAVEEIMGKEVYFWPSVKKKGNKKKNAIKAYRTILGRKRVYLNKNTSSAPAKDIEFKLFDIDKNGVPELLCFYSSASVIDGYQHILGIVNGKVKSIAHSYASSFVFYKNAIIEETGGARGNTWTYYYKFNGRKNKKIASLDRIEKYTDGKKNVKKYYKVNGRKVSHAKYRAFVRKIKKGKPLMKNWTGVHKNTKKNRKKYL